MPLPMAVADVLVSLLACWLMLQLHRRDRDASLRWWAASFALQGATSAAVAQRAFGTEIQALTRLGGLTAVLAIVFLVVGCHKYIGLELRRRWLALPLGLAAYMLVASAMELSFFWFVLPVSLALGSGLLFVGVVIMRRGEGSVGATLAGIGLSVYGVHMMDFPFVSSHPDLLVWGHMLATFLQVTVVIGFLLLYSEHGYRLLAERELHYRALFDNAATGIFEANEDGRVIEANATLRALVAGGAPMKGLGLATLFEDQEAAASVLSVNAGSPSALTTRWRATDGRVLDVEIHSQWLNMEGRPPQLEGVVIDVTRAEHLERHISHVQRTDMLGQLAGGIAHDINNVLTVVLGNASLLQRRLGSVEPASKAIAGILEASTQGARLTRQLLTFVRRHPTKVIAFELGLRVQVTGKMLQPTLGESIDLRVAVAEEGCGIFADSALIEQIVVNLIVNARDALPDGGRIDVRVSATEGQVVLAVSDDGVGMSPEVKGRVFEPFFTTKPDTEGTGLGLAVVHRAVRQSGGSIELDTEVGRGTTFQVRFPQVSVPSELAPSPTEDAAPAPVPSTSSVLLVEDRDDVRAALVEMLEDAGFVVTAPSTPANAMSYIARGGGADVLVTDVLMPEYSGQEIARVYSEHQSDPRVIFISGFANEPDLLKPFDPETTRFLSKPFLPEELIATILAILAAAADAPEPAAKKSVVDGSRYSIGPASG